MMTHVSSFRLFGSTLARKGMERWKSENWRPIPITWRPEVSPKSHLLFIYDQMNNSRAGYCQPPSNSLPAFNLPFPFLRLRNCEIPQLEKRQTEGRAFSSSTRASNLPGGGGTQAKLAAA
eukprot:1158896-Pelagomonas_calceolata.AAC.11